jgi:hypothetical protein
MVRGLVVRKVAVFVFLCLSVVATAANSAFGVAPNPVTFNFETSTISGFNGPYHIITADFNNDTKLDLAVTNWPGDQLTILLGDGLGNFSVVSTLTTGVHPNFITAGDFDNTGSIDLAVTNGSGLRDVTRFFNDGTGTSWTTSTLSIGSDADVSSIVAANFTPSTDSNIDLFIVKNSGIVADFYEVWQGNGSGGFTEIASANTGNFPIFAAAGDFNGDGSLDIAVANYDSNSLTILLGNGDGTFSAAAGSPITVGTNPRAIAPGHLNGDAHTDLAVTNLGSNTVSILLGNGDGTFSAAANVTSSGGVAGIVISDFDGDGKNDLAVTRFNANVVSIYRGNGDGTFDSTSIDFSVGMGPFFIASGDFDKDGKPDLALTNYTSNDVTVLLNRSVVCLQAPEDMVSWWTADGNANDVIGGNGGTLANGTTYSAGMVDQAFCFDGVDDYVQVSGTVADFGSNPFSVDFWMNSNNDGNIAYVLGKSHPDGGQGWDIRLHDNRIQVVGVDGWPAQWNIQTDQVIVANQWHHVAVTATASAVEVYVDGILRGSSGRQTISLASNPFRIGFTSNFGGTAFNGLLDEVQIYDRTLAAEEIAAIYAAGSAGMCLAEDTTPDPFSFTDQTDVELNTLVTSDAVTVTGINAAASISVSGGEYEINSSGTWTSEDGTINNNDTVRVRQTSSDSFSTQTDTTLTIGGVSDIFSVTTLAADTTPDAFSFTDQTDVPLSTLITSNTITVAGINSSSPISITGGQYSVNGGTYTASAGTVNNGDTVSVRQTSSASFNTTTNATLTIGGVSDSFSVTTLELLGLVVTSANGGESWQSGTTQTIRWDYAGNPGTYVKIDLLKGGVLTKTLTSFAKASARSYSWKIPAIQTPGADYAIRITSKTDPALTDTSDTTFTVLGPSVTLTSPDGGENWGPGTTQTIRWTYAGSPGTSLKIELLKGGILNRVITTFASTSRGYYSWKVPATQAAGGDYSIRITSKTNPFCADVSNADFAIGGATATF